MRPLMHERLDEQGVSNTVIIAVAIIGIAFLIGGSMAYFYTRAGPNFKVKDLSISQEKVAKGVPLTAQVRVTNTGDAKGTHTIRLKLDRETLKKEVTLEAGESRTVDFDIEKQEKGTYSLSIGDLSESFEVVEPARFEVSNLIVRPSEKYEDIVVVSVDVKNKGGKGGAGKLKLHLYDPPNVGKHTETRSVSVESGESKKVSMSVVRNSKDIWDLRISGISGNLENVEPAGLRISNFRVSPAPRPTLVGEKCTASVDVKNTGEIKVNYRANWKVEGKVMNTRKITLSPGESRTISFSKKWKEEEMEKVYSDMRPYTFGNSPPPTFKVGINGMSKPIEVRMFEVSDLRVNYHKFRGRIVVKASVLVKNKSNETWTEEVNFGSRELHSGAVKAVTLDPRESKRVSMTFRITSVQLPPSGENTNIKITAAGLSQRIKVKVPKQREFSYEIKNFYAGTGSPGEAIDISAEVVNTGDKRGTVELKLEVDGASYDPKQVTLSPGESISVEWEFSTEVRGTYTASLNGLTNNFGVYGKWRVGPINLAEGKKGVLMAEVKNTSDDDAKFDYYVKSGGEVIDRKNTNLAPNEFVNLYYDEDELDGISYMVIIESDENPGALSVSSKAGKQKVID